MKLLHFLLLGVFIVTGAQGGAYTYIFRNHMNRPIHIVLRAGSDQRAMVPARGQARISGSDADGKGGECLNSGSIITRYSGSNGGPNVAHTSVTFVTSAEYDAIMHSVRTTGKNNTGFGKHQSTYCGNLVLDIVDGGLSDQVDIIANIDNPW